MEIPTKPVWQDRETYNRVFIPSSTNEGCPVGCSYCYVTNKGKQPIPFAPEQYAEILASVREDERYEPGGTLVSLGCESDPLLPELLPSTIQALEYFSKDNTPLIQIASKLIIPKELRDFARDWPFAKYRPAFSVSIATIALATNLEPYAPSPQERATNFDVLHEVMRWPSIALVKPFMKTTQREAPEFSDLLLHHQPDAIVVGEKYRRGIGNLTTKVHPLAEEWSRQEQLNPRRAFMHELMNAGLGTTPMFDSSVDAAIHFIQK